MNLTNITTFEPSINKSFDIIFIIFITIISLCILCCLSCYLLLIIIHFIKFILLYLCYYNYHTQENKNSKIKHFYDIIFGSLSLPVLTDVVIVNIPNNNT